MLWKLFIFVFIRYAWFYSLGYIRRKAKVILKQMTGCNWHTGRNSIMSIAIYHLILTFFLSQLSFHSTCQLQIVLNETKERT